MDGLTIIFLIISFLVGATVSFFLWNAMLRKRKDNIIKEGRTEAEVLKKDKILQAKEKFLELKNEHEKYINEKNSKINQQEQKLKQKEQNFSQRSEELNRKNRELEAIKGNLSSQMELLEKREAEVEKTHKAQVEQLEAISGMSVEDAKAQLMESLKAEARTEAMSYINDIMEEAKISANKEAKRIVIQTIQRVATEEAIENSVTVFNIDNDDIKGRIIGREGRNIRALEAATGIEIIVDDTPEAIILSGFDPVRREIARLSLHKLVTDGRIHPARIEEVVAKTKKQIDQEILEIGKRTTIDLGIHGMHHELVRLVGKMKYRSSYGQNLL